MQLFSGKIQLYCFIYKNRLRHNFVHGAKVKINNVVFMLLNTDLKNCIYFPPNIECVN
jgi:hypothetical protein